MVSMLRLNKRCTSKYLRTCKIFASNQFTGQLKGIGHRIWIILKPMPSYQPERNEVRQCQEMRDNPYKNGPKPFDIPCFCITLRNLIMTFELGRMSTCLFPAFSALLIALSASLRTLVLTMLTVLRFSTQR